jgi:hypothetical protein
MSLGPHQHLRNVQACRPRSRPHLHDLPLGHSHRSGCHRSPLSVRRSRLKSGYLTDKNFDAISTEP